MALDFSRNLMRIRYINLNPYRRASLPARCGSAVTQFKMADKLVAALNDKRNLTGIKKALIFTEGKNTLKNYGVFVFELLGS